MHVVVLATLGVDIIIGSIVVVDSKLPLYERCLPQSGCSTAGIILLCLRCGLLNQQQGGLRFCFLSFSTYKVALLKGKIIKWHCQCQHVGCAGIGSQHQPVAMDFVRTLCTIAATTVGAQLSVMVGAVAGFHWPTCFSVSMDI